MWPFRKKKVVCELDYDKLAQAIVKAQETVEQKKQEEEQKKSRFTSGFMSWLVAAFFFLLATACLFAAIVFVVAIVQWCLQYPACTNFSEIRAHTVGLIILIFLTLFALLFMLLCFFSAREVDKETDKHYLSTLFSGTIGFVALIVAIAALVLDKG